MPLGVVERIVMCVVALVLTAGSLVHKLSCTVPRTNPDGSVVPVLTRVTRTACYSDVQALFGRRELGLHLFPYVNGTYSTNPPDVHGGTVEYPTLTGLWVWLSALPVSTVQGFLVVTALTFVPAVVIITLVLQRLAGRRAWIWAATPPLFLYALYNWDVLPVMMTVLGLLFALVGPPRWSPTTRAVLAGTAFGIGGAFKLYPVMFVVPLALGFLLDRDVVGRWRRAIGCVGAAALAVLLANLPFVVVNEAGWASVFRFQAARAIDASTLSIWYWGLLPWSGTGSAHSQHLMGLASTGSTAVGILAVLVAGVVLARRTGRMPWVQTAGAMLAVYMLCNKVDSLQYTLWLLPFLAVLRIRIGWVIAYGAADLAAFVGWYRSVYYHSVGDVATTWADQALTVGVFGRAALLFALCFVFLGAEVVTRGTVDAPAEPVADAVPGESPDAYASMER